MKKTVLKSIWFIGSVFDIQGHNSFKYSKKISSLLIVFWIWKYFYFSHWTAMVVYLLSIYLITMLGTSLFLFQTYKCKALELKWHSSIYTQVNLNFSNFFRRWIYTSLSALNKQRRQLGGLILTFLQDKLTTSWSHFLTSW